MLPIGQRVPAQEFLGTFRNRRNHLEQHDGFVEVVQVIGSQAGARIDIGGAQLSDPCRIRVCAARCRSMDRAGLELFDFIFRSLDGRG